VPELSKPTPIGSREPAVQPHQQATSPFEQELALGWYIHSLSRRWRVLLVVALLGAAGGYALASLRPILFEGVTTLLVVPPTRTPTAQINPATFRAILENASMAAKVIADTGLSQTPQTFLENSLQIEQPAGTNVLRVRVRLEDPKTAADVSRRLANDAIALTRRLNQEEGSSLQDQLKSHLQDAALRLAAAEKEFLSYQQSAQVELVKEDTDAMLAERAELLKLTIAIESERARLASAEREIARQKPLLSATRSVGAEEALQHTMERARGSEQTAADPQSLDLTNPYINPVYQTLDFQIATSRTRLAALDQQRRQIVDVSKIGGKELAQLSELYRRRIELARLEMDFESAKQIHGDLRVRYEESRTQALGFSPQLQLVAEAIVPDRPLPRQRVRYSALGFVIGLLGAGAVALILEIRG
jgi:polysaccharide biosynthesis transport protein